MLALDAQASARTNDEQVLLRLNGWFRTPLILVESTSSRQIAGMTELVTDTRFRVFIDLLTGFAEDERPRLHPISVSAKEADDTAREGDGARLSFVYAKLVAPRDPMDQIRRGWMLVLEARYRKLASERVDMALSADLTSLAKLLPDENAIELDLSNRYVENFRIARLLTIAADFEGTPRVRLRATNAVFAGEIADFSDAVFDVVDLEWAIFTTPTVTFRNAIFDCTAEEDDSYREQVINLRDVTFCETVDRIVFDDVRITADTIAVSLEDAVVRGGLTTFTRAHLGRAALDCFQTQFLGGASLEFIETKMSEARIEFVDAFFEPMSGVNAEGPPASLVLYRVDPVAPADFAFRWADHVRIENCTVQAPMRFANVGRLSFWGSSIAGGLMSVDAQVKPGASSPRALSKFWFLDAVQNGRTRQRANLSAEFAVIKEVFHSMGEYDLEDEAFVRHMRFKGSRLAGRATFGLLDIIGRFGTSPHRTLAWLALTWLMWLLVNASHMALSPSEFSGTFGDVILDAIVYTNASLTQGGASVVPVSFLAHLLWLFQSLCGWFFLGYLFSAFVRKTLR